MRCSDSPRAGDGLLLVDTAWVEAPTKAQPGRAGRGRENDLALENRHLSVSRRYAEIRKVGQRFVLVDLGSKNATRLTGLRIIPGQAHPLRCGDRIEVGDFVVDLAQTGG